MYQPGEGEKLTLRRVSLIRWIQWNVYQHVIIFIYMSLSQWYLLASGRKDISGQFGVLCWMLQQKGKLKKALKNAYKLCCGEEAARRFSIYIKCLWVSFCCFSKRGKKSEHIDSLGDVTVRNMKNSKSQLRRSLTSAAMLMLWFITSTNIVLYNLMDKSSKHQSILQHYKLIDSPFFPPRSSSAPGLVEIKINWWNSSNYIVLSHELQLIVEFLSFYHRRNEMEILGWVEDWCIESIISHSESRVIQRHSNNNKHSNSRRRDLN